MSRYENHHLEDRALPFIYKQSVAPPTYRMPGSSNWHENIELLYVTRGSGVISNNGQVLSVGAGDVAVINANHLHTLAADEEPMAYRYLIVDRAFCLANGFDTNAIRFAPLIRDDGLRVLLEELHGAYGIAAEAPYRTLQIRTAVLRLMVALCNGYGTPSQRSEQSEGSVAHVKAAIDYIRASYGKSFSLEDVAAFVGMNKCYLSREFHKYTGYTFVAYVNRTRCKMAQRLLLDGGLSIREVGERCGFESPSYFARSFQRYVGMLPGEYRAQGGGELPSNA
ncbi:MAG: AraC family transcriptional regulator [Ruminococcaceae bacterium]|nr:AraC family transcriptional regulator [Oscillospiraceae bacterium]